MKKIVILAFFGFWISCQQKEQNQQKTSGDEQISHASGLSIQSYPDFKLLTIKKPWPDSQKDFYYVLHEEGFKIPDSLRHWQAIQVPIETVVVTSTTHIPPLELLGLEVNLIGFPNTDYVSSLKTRTLIDAGKVREVGTNQALNTEVLLEMAPSVIIGFGVEGQNAAYDLLIKSGIPVVYNGDWTEQNPLGRAEWIKLFGVLFGKEAQARKVFQDIENSYHEVQDLASKLQNRPTVMAGAIYQDQWYAPQGKSWAANFIKEAAGNYVWSKTSGVGSLAMSFETVLEQAQNAEVWVGPAQFTSYDEMLKSNPNYQYFKAFQNKKIYSFSSKKGATGGVIYYEEASSRPDLVLKDLVKILHPDLMSNHQLYFFEAIK